MREVANFMRFYPAYQLRDVLAMPAISFFALLNEAYRLKYGDYLMLAQLADLPNMEAKDRREFYRNLEWASTHPADILKGDGESSSPAEIKKMLKG